MRCSGTGSATLRGRATPHARGGSPQSGCGGGRLTLCWPRADTRAPDVRCGKPLRSRGLRCRCRAPSFQRPYRQIRAPEGGQSPQRMPEDRRARTAPFHHGDALAASGGSANAIAFLCGSRTFTWRTRFESVSIGSCAMRRAARRSSSASSPATATVIRLAPARAAFGSMKSQARSSSSQRISSPTRRSSGGRPKNRVYQSMPASRSDTGPPAKRRVIAPPARSALSLLT
jgi:hypothetical protein